jgi:hypothetical protein
MENVVGNEALRETNRVQPSCDTEQKPQVGGIRKLQVESENLQPSMVEHLMLR